MTKLTPLMAEILKDPEATYQIEIDLPGGNMIKGTLGPFIGNRLSVSVYFLRDPTEEEKAAALDALDKAIGKKSALAAFSKTAAEKEVANAAMRRFFGGGQG